MLQEIARDGERQDLPLVDAEVGGLLRVLATSLAATRILEIGTAIGYSGIWLAGALPANGMLLTIEMDPERAATARGNFARAGLADRVSVDRRRRAADAGEGRRAVRSHFSGRRQALYVPLLDRLVELLRPGGLLVTDNVLWDGEVVPGLRQPAEAGRRRHGAIAEYNERLNAHPRLMTATVPLRDGVSISVKRS